MSKKTYDLLILGSGAAGLQAAWELSHAPKKMDWLMLEANDCMGGRLKPAPKFRVPGLSLDLGAEFIHGDSPVLDEWIKRGQLVSLELPEGHGELGPRGLRLRKDFWHILEAMLSRLHSDLKGDDISVEEALRKFRGKKWTKEIGLLRSYVEGFHGADLSKMSFRSLKSEEQEAGEIRQNRRLLGGYHSLLQAFQASIPRLDTKLHLRTRATHVEWSPKRVRVRAVGAHGRMQIFLAKKILITLPIGVLKLDASHPAALSFEPPVAELNERLKCFESGHAFKVILEFDEVLWDKKLHLPQTTSPVNYVHSPKLNFPTWWTYSPLQVPWLTAWAGGPRAVKLSALSHKPQALQKLLLADLSKIFGRSLANKMRAQFKRAHFHDWSRDAYACGAYSYVAPNGRRLEKSWAKPIAGTLYFAGEAWGGEGGTVESALASGRAMARKILRSL